MFKSTNLHYGALGVFVGAILLVVLGFVGQSLLTLSLTLTGRSATPVVSFEDVEQAIQSNPNWLSRLRLGDLPTEDEARYAFETAHLRSGLVYREENVSVSLRLGECAESPLGPGIMCLVSVTLTQGQQTPLDRYVLFARNADNRWSAQLM